MTTLAVLATVLPVLSFAAPKEGQPQAAQIYLSQAKVLYQAMEYERCLSRLDKAPPRAAPKEVEGQFELYAALCNAGLSRTERAKEHFERALALDPDVQLPAGTSPVVTESFELARAHRPKRPPRAESAPSTTEVTAPRAVSAPSEERATPPSLAPLAERPREEAIPSLRPGAPDLALAPSTSNAQSATEPTKGKRSLLLPGGLGALSLGALATGVVFGAQARSFESQARTARFDSDMTSLSAKAQSRAGVANGCFVGAGVLLGAAVLVFILGS